MEMMKEKLPMWPSGKSRGNWTAMLGNSYQKPKNSEWSLHLVYNDLRKRKIVRGFLPHSSLALVLQTWISCLAEGQCDVKGLPIVRLTYHLNELHVSNLV